MSETAQVSPVLHLRLCLGYRLGADSDTTGSQSPNDSPQARVGDSESRVNIGLGAAGGSELISRDLSARLEESQEATVRSSTCVCMIRRAKIRRVERIGAWRAGLLITETPEPKADVALATETRATIQAENFRRFVFCLSSIGLTCLSGILEKRVDESTEQDARGICSFAADAIFLFEQMASHLTPDMELKTCSFFFFF